MANPEHSAKLLEGVDAWNEWKNENPDTEPDLRGVNLEGMNLKGAILFGAHLEGAILYRTHLEGANLYESYLQDAILYEAHLEGAILFGAHMEGANLYGAHLQGAILYGAHLERANLYEAHLDGADLTNADFRARKISSLAQRFIPGAFKPVGNANRISTAADFCMSGIRMLPHLLPLLKEFVREPLTDIRAAKLTGCKVEGVKFNRWIRCHGVGLDACYGSEQFKRFVGDQAYVEELRSTSKGRFVYWIWLFFCDCGRMPLLWFIWCLAIIFAFAGIYSFLGSGGFTFFAEHAFNHTWLYLSVTTFTTFGIGDIAPKSAAAANWMMLEVFLGYAMLGGLISILASKMWRRA